MTVGSASRSTSAWVMGQIVGQPIRCSSLRGPGRGTSSPVSLCELSAQGLQPVAQAQRADDIVAVVLLDLVEMVGGRALALAELQPLLEGDDARTRHRAGRSRA